MPPDTSKLTRQDLYNIAVYQKAILVCILVYVLAVIAQFALPQEARLFLALGVVGLGVVATVFVFLLTLKVYGVTSPGLRAPFTGLFAERLGPPLRAGWMIHPHPPSPVHGAYSTWLEPRNSHPT